MMTNAIFQFKDRVAQQQIFRYRQQVTRLRQLLDEKDREIETLKTTIDNQCQQLQALRELSTIPKEQI